MGEVRGQVEWRRVTLFVAIAYGVAWAVSLYIYWTGGLTANAQEGTLPGSWRLLLLVVGGIMTAPALAHVLTRWMTREGWQGLYLSPRLRQGWPMWAAAWLLPAVCTAFGALVYFALWPGYFDPNLGMLREMLAASEAQTGQSIPLPAETILLIQFAQGILLAPILNALPTFGEEFGWRAYLALKLLPLGWRKAMILMGIIWGVWHWPLIAMGHNYGQDYPGAPWAGMLLFVWFAFVVGTMLAWLSLRGGSVWPAVIGHGALNGIAGAPIFFAQGDPNPLLGPMAVGFVGMLAFTAVGLWMFWRSPLIDPTP
jgi:membrane protease YdiL (CAAX protease family)